MLKCQGEGTMTFLFDSFYKTRPRTTRIKVAGPQRCNHEDSVAGELLNICGPCPAMATLRGSFNRGPTGKQTNILEVQTKTVSSCDRLFAHNSNSYSKNSKHASSIQLDSPVYWPIKGLL